MRIFEKYRVTFPKIARGSAPYCINVDHESRDQGVWLLERHLRRDLYDCYVFSLLDLKAKVETSLDEFMA